MHGKNNYTFRWRGACRAHVVVLRQRHAWAGGHGDKALTDAEVVADAMAYVADSVDASPPAGRRGLHPGLFTIDWGNARVFRNGGLDVVNAPISATNHYSGVFPASQADSVLGDYAAAIYQRLVLTLDRRYWRHGAFVATVIPDAAHATADEGAIAPTVYSGDPRTGFSGMMTYSLVGSNATVTVERFEDGLNTGRVSLFNPRSSRFEISAAGVSSMRSLAGGSRTGRGQLRPATRSGDDPPEPGGDSPNNDGILTDARSDDGYGFGSGDNPVGLGDVVCTSPKPGGSGSGYTGDDGSFDTGQSDTSTDSLDSGPSLGAGGIGSNTVNRANNGKLTTEEVESIELKFLLMLDDNCGFDAAFAAIGGFIGLTGGMFMNTSMMANAQYDAQYSSISFNGSTPNVRDYSMMEEVVHFIQDRTYVRGIGDYGGHKKGSANIEFEAKIVGDLYYMAKYNDFPTGQSNVLMMYQGSVAESYQTFVENIQNGVYTQNQLNAAFLQQLQNLSSAGLGWLDTNLIDTSVMPQLLGAYGEEFDSNDCGGNAVETLPQPTRPAGKGGSNSNKGITTSTRQ